MMTTDWNDWTIVLDPLASSPERYAADELQGYLRNMTGKLPKIVEVVEPFEPHLRRPLQSCVYVGTSRLLKKQHPDLVEDDLAEDEVLIRKQQDTVVLTGGGKRGTLYAVYTLLERFMGCRFFTEDDELVPEAAAPLPETIEYRSAPSFATRDSLSLYMRTGRWAAKLRMNGHFANVSSLHGFKHGLFPFVHTFAHIVPPERYFKRHPEYFSLINGERNPKQLCLSNPKVQELITKQVLRWIRENPDYDIFSLSENDGGGFCECDECWKMNGKEVRESYGHASQPGSFFRLVNLVAREVGRRYPDKWIDTLSYSYYNLTPPQHFGMEPNVMVRVCMNVDGRNRLRQWLKAAHRVGIWHYFTYRHFLLPFPLITNSIPTVLREYRDLGVQDVMLQMPEDEHGGVESLKMQVYAASKLFWNADEDPYPHVREFIRHYYGPAADEMQKVFDLTQSVLKAKGARWDCWKWEMDTVPLLRRAMPELERRVKPLFEHGRRVARGSKYRVRVAEAALPFRYFDLMKEDRPPRFTAGRAYAMDVRPVRKSTRELVRTLDALKINFWHHDHTLDVLKNALAPLPLCRLKTRFLELLILPDVGGRLVQVVDRRTQQRLIPEGLNLFHFEANGYEEYVGRWYHGPGYRESYDAVAQGRTGNQPWVKLRATLDEFRIERRVTLRGSGFTVESTLTNLASRAEKGELRLHGRWRCDPARDDVRIEGDGGKAEGGRLEEFKNREIHDVKNASVTYTLNSLGLSMVQRLEGDWPEKMMLLSRNDTSSGNHEGGHVVVDVFACPHRLGSGQSLTLTQSYTIEQL